MIPARREPRTAGAVLYAAKRSEKEMAERKSILEASQIDAIEGRLAGTLRPVEPPDDFVERLRGHIHLPERSQIVIRLQEWQRLGLAVGGVLSGAVLVLTFARAMYQLFWKRSG